MADKFCSPENISVVIPYADFEKMLKAATSYEQTNAKVKRLEDQLGALRSQFIELMDKFAELQKEL